MQVTTINYDIDGAPFQGMLVCPQTTTPLPGLLLAPNWLGVTADAVRRATVFAQQGYRVFVADMYGAAHRPQGFEQAAPLANAIRAEPLLARKRMLKALDVLEQECAQRALLLSDQRAAVGFCFGGGNVLELARAGAPIQAAVSIHGDLTTLKPASAGDIKAALLVLHGSADPVVPKDHRDAFEAEMSACGATWQMLIFGNLLHAYTDIGANHPGVAQYDEYACARTYELTHRFVSDAFAGFIQQ